MLQEGHLGSAGVFSPHLTPSSGPHSQHLPPDQGSGAATHRAASGLGAESYGPGACQGGEGGRWLHVGVSEGGPVRGGSDPAPSREEFKRVTWEMR